MPVVRVQGATETGIQYAIEAVFFNNNFDFGSAWVWNYEELRSLCQAFLRN